MFWSIFLYIICILTGIFILLALVALFSPLSFSAEFSYFHTYKNAQISAFWLHPSVFKFLYSTENRISDIRIFRFFRIKKKLDEEPAAGEEQPESDRSVSDISTSITEPTPEMTASEPIEVKISPESTPVDSVPMDKKKEKRDNLLKRLKKILVSIIY